MGISKRTIEELIAKNDAAIVRAKAEIARCEGETSAYRKILAADAPPPATAPRMAAGELEQRCIAAIQAAGKPLTVVELIAALGDTDSPKRRGNINSALHKKAKDKKIFVRTGTAQYGLITIGHTENGAMPQPSIVKPMGA
jgi:hypothetical protein